MRQGQEAVAAETGVFGRIRSVQDGSAQGYLARSQSKAASVFKMPLPSRSFRSTLVASPAGFLAVSFNAFFISAGGTLSESQLLRRAASTPPAIPHAAEVPVF